MKRLYKAGLSVSALAMAALAVPANSATIVLNDVGGVTGSQAERGFQIAAAYWESILLDNVTINLDVGFSSLAPNVLGGASSSLFQTTAVNYYGALAADATSNLDVSAVTNLEPLSANGGLTMITPGYLDPVNELGIDTTTTIVDNDDSFNNTNIIGSSANLKALGFALPPGVTDANITFNSDQDFDFDPTDGITPGAFDFIGVAIHEIGHALGFLSGTDFYDFEGCPNGPACTQTQGANPNDFLYGQVMDLFRYSDEGELNWAPGEETYFSIDGGATEFLGNANFSTGDFNGDGRQASHWKGPGGCTGLIGIMNPYLCDGFNSVVTANDLGAFDAIGWDISFDVLQNPNYTANTRDIFRQFAPVPEPSTWLQLILGFGLLGAFMRSARRRSDVATA